MIIGIEILKRGRKCDACSSDKNVKMLIIQSGFLRHFITLCRDCRSRLTIVLESEVLAGFQKQCESEAQKNERIKKIEEIIMKSFSNKNVVQCPVEHCEKENCYTCKLYELYKLIEGICCHRHTATSKIPSDLKWLARDLKEFKKFKEQNYKRELYPETKIQWETIAGILKKRKRQDTKVGHYQDDQWANDEYYSLPLWLGILGEQYGALCRPAIKSQ